MGLICRILYLMILLPFTSIRYNVNVEHTNENAITRNGINLLKDRYCKILPYFVLIVKLMTG